MAGMLTQPQPGSNTAILHQAYAQVATVRFELQALLPQAQALGAASATLDQLGRWQTTLQSAYDLLGQIVVIQIFPPPPIATYVNNARSQIQAVISALRSIPVTTISPPSLSRGAIPLQTLQTLIGALQQAEADILRAIQSTFVTQ